MDVPNEQDPLQMSAAIQYVINESAPFWKQPLVPAESNIIGYIERILKFQVLALRQEMGYPVIVQKRPRLSSWYSEWLRYILFIIFATLVCFVLLWVVGEKTVGGR
jgi:branched-subunit amino acid transport protein